MLSQATVVSAWCGTVSADMITAHHSMDKAWWHKHNSGKLAVFFNFFYYYYFLELFGVSFPLKWQKGS